ncbi:hypothetical protein [Azonexus sp. IMCC34839]|uniref:hypothetical protein n=1 Tax=Azonexus sp. IMCC34839 TaxID=3133695 RepID=UPI0039997139
MNQFVCPACGRQVFNRLHGKCEFCGKDLPASILLSPDQLAYLAEEDQKIEKIRNDLARRAAEESRKKIRRRGEGG